MKFGIVTDSSCDLPESYTAQEEVTVVSFYVSFDGENYLKEGKEAGITEFYQKMADNPDCYPKTSMPSVQDYIDAFLPVVKKGLPVLCICLTKNFSGSMQSAVTAKEEVEEEFPQAKIEVVNSQLVTALQGLFVKEAFFRNDFIFPACNRIQNAVRFMQCLFYYCRTFHYVPPFLSILLSYFCGIIQLVMTNS